MFVARMRFACGFEVGASVVGDAVRCSGE